MSTEDLMSKALAMLAEVDQPVSVETIRLLTDAGDPDGPMAIGEVAVLLDVSPHTLRYYERAGLVTVDRDAAGYRVYDAAAVRRLAFLSRMRLSGMSMSDLRRYVRLVDAGAGTVPERMEMLLEHRAAIRRQIRELTLSLTATEFKIATYGGHTGD